MTLSRPLVIGLLGLVLLVAAYMATSGMRSPEGGDSAAPARKPAPARTGAPARSPAAASTARTDRKAPTARPADRALAGLPRPVARALSARRLTVLLLAQPGGSDDAEVRSAVRALRPLGVRVFVDDISRVERYSPIANSVSVAQAPSTVILTPDRRARLIEGYVDPTTLRQLLVDTIR